MGNQPKISEFGYVGKRDGYICVEKAKLMGGTVVE